MPIIHVQGEDRREYSRFPLRLGDAVYPVGALDLSMSAVQLSSRTFTQGKFVPGPGFSKVTAGALTLGYTGGLGFTQLL
ncbi:hypothetical protein HYDPIDRAFT_115414 [Hydnomerulius pinastri MD-312]|uniref:Uncharacterized protein n=1 Tax=Hydnomerulius pinastri MD-312 TaxID=994086 RepID=A0A0C9W5F2_9AGAM|nr:hypothetical protein HYDPIDRAFT_115414 [Hydnomerulius pinastri MD-312]